MCAQSEPVRHVEHEGHHIAAVTPGVGIVRLDDVSQQHGGPPVRVSELQGMVDANLPLAREVGQQPDQRERDDDQRRVCATSERRQDRDRGQGKVDGPDPHHEAQEAPW